MQYLLAVCCSRTLPFAAAHQHPILPLTAVLHSSLHWAPPGLPVLLATAASEHFPPQTLLPSGRVINYFPFSVMITNGISDLLFSRTISPFCLQFNHSYLLSLC